MLSGYCKNHHQKHAQAFMPPGIAVIPSGMCDMIHWPGRRFLNTAFFQQISKRNFQFSMQGGYYRVQCGAYTIRGNAERKAAELKNMGFDAIIKEYKL